MGWDAMCDPIVSTQAEWNGKRVATGFEHATKRVPKGYSSTHWNYPIEIE